MENLLITIVDGAEKLTVYDNNTANMTTTQHILDLIAAHNEAVNVIIADHDLVGDDDWQERIEMLQHSLEQSVRKMLAAEKEVADNQLPLDFPLTNQP